MSDDIGRNPTPEELERILRPGLPSPGPVERFATWPADYVAPDGAALFGVPVPDHPEVRGIVGKFAESMDWGGLFRSYAERMERVAMHVLFDRVHEIRYDTSWRPIEEIRARAATSRYWARRLRWLRKRGRA